MSKEEQNEQISKIKKMLLNLDEDEQYVVLNWLSEALGYFIVKVVK